MKAFKAVIHDWTLTQHAGHPNTTADPPLWPPIRRQMFTRKLYTFENKLRGHANNSLMKGHQMGVGERPDLLIASLQYEKGTVCIGSLFMAP